MSAAGLRGSGDQLEQVATSPGPLPLCAREDQRTRTETGARSVAHRGQLSPVSSQHCVRRGEVRVGAAGLAEARTRRHRPPRPRCHLGGPRQDRNLNEAFDSADPLKLMRLFGITDQTAMRYFTAAHPERTSIRAR
jgi:hypothetical protein